MPNPHLSPATAVISKAKPNGAAPLGEPDACMTFMSDTGRMLAGLGIRS